MTEDRTERREEERARVFCPRCAQHHDALVYLDGHGHPAVEWLGEHRGSAMDRDEAIERMADVAAPAFGKFFEHPDLADRFLNGALSANDSQPQPGRLDDEDES